MRVKKIANAESAGATSSSNSTRKASAKRARSPEFTTSGESDADQPKSKRTKQTKASAVEKSDTKSGSKNGSTSQVIQVNESHPPAPTYLGKFDLYNMELSFLSKLYPQNGASTPQYEEIYRMILTHQGENDNTAQFSLEPPDSPSPRLASILESPNIMDPMTEYPFEIVIGSIKHNASLSLPKDKLPSIGRIPGGPGISALTSLGGDRCGIRSASGVFKLKRVWADNDSPNGFAELFAGYFTFNVSYGGMYKSLCRGKGQKHKWGFWAIRAKTGDDESESSS